MLDINWAPGGQRQGPNSASDMPLLVKVWYNSSYPIRSSSMRALPSCPNSLVRSSADHTNRLRSSSPKVVSVLHFLPGSL